MEGSAISLIRDRTSSARKIGVGVITLTSEQVLLGFNYKKQWWEISGGSQEGIETILEAAQRELTEETGLQSSNLKFIGYIDNYSNNWVSMVFGNLLSVPLMGLKFEEKTFTCWNYYSFNNLPKGMSPLTLRCIKLAQDYYGLS